MKNYYQQYEMNQNQDKNLIINEYIKTAKAHQIPIEENPKTLDALIDMDIRENVPPQLYELIGCIVEMFEKVESKK
ncbi:MAG: hypothetical protein JXR88_14700 [Clostridia bacterium]|nr:hypothetical protein [Clostridia bacterium]